MNLKDIIIENYNGDTLSKIIFSNPRDKKLSKINVKIIEIKGKKLFQIEEFKENKAIHINLKLSEFLEFLKTLNYKQIAIITLGKTYQMLKNKNGYKIKESDNSCNEISLNHNKNKKYILNEGEPIPFLIYLGVMGEDGNVFKRSYDKFRQINKYLEFIDDTIEELRRKKLIDKTIKVVDFGCGKSYLTFALYHYLHNIKNIDCTIIGLDLKSDVITKCNDIAKNLGYSNLTFLTGDIKDFDKLQNVDMIFSLHACNNATDYAILKGLELNASAILAVPCCQHEFNQKMSQNKDSDFWKYERPIGDYGILFEKYTTLATDAYRALALEICGYKAQVMEFIDMSHTPKNVLIRAIKDKNIDFDKKYSEYQNFMRYFGFVPILDNLIKPYIKEKKI